MVVKQVKTLGGKNTVLTVLHTRLASVKYSIISFINGACFVRKTLPEKPYFPISSLTRESRVLLSNMKLVNNHCTALVFLFSTHNRKSQRSLGLSTLVSNKEAHYKLVSTSLEQNASTPILVLIL